MDIKRMFLYGAWLLVAMLLWTEWQKETSAPVVSPGVEASQVTVPKLMTEEAGADRLEAKSIGAPKERLISVETDVLALEIDKYDGHIVHAKLLNFPVSSDQPQEPVKLLNADPDTFYQAQIGITDAAGHRMFTSPSEHYELGAQQDTLEVTLLWEREDGLKIERMYRFHRGQYQIEIETQIHNHTAYPWTGQVYYQILRKEPDSSGGTLGMSSYVGAAISDPAHKRYEKVSFKDIRKRDLHRTVKGGWVAMQQHYFLSAFVPLSPSSLQFFSQHYAGNLHAIGMAVPALTVQPHQTEGSAVKLFIGPKQAELLESVAPGLDLTVDYGWLWFISIGIFWLLKHLYQYIGNWGWAIVAVTVLIKMAFYYLSASSYRSMAKMRQFQPRIEALKERYGDDRQKFSQAMMELYKKEKVNPLGGCLPMLVQIPVFIALYWVLLASVELRQAPFMGWIQDLSVKDPFYVLPILMGLSMVLQQRMSPAPPDPIQAKMMMVLPIVFTFLFLNFPSGLVLYWLVNNVLSILQQWYITRNYTSKSLARTTVSSGSKS